MYSYKTKGPVLARFSLTQKQYCKRNPFIGGCMGNTQGVAALCKGRNIDDIISTLKGIDCGGRGTSCPDQLALALLAYKQQQAQTSRF